jgi:pimeloyl-ACP methyl ester carboxylesterase
MIGFGLSEKPVREQAHSLDRHISNLVSLLRQLDVRNVTTVYHDWGGQNGLGFTLANPRALVIREHTGLGATLKPAKYAGFIFKALIPPRQLL